MPSRPLSLALTTIAAGLQVLSRKRAPKRTSYLNRTPTGEPIRKALVTEFRRQRTLVLKAIQRGRGQRDLGGWVFDDFASVLGPTTLPLADRMTPLIQAYWDESGQQVLGRLGFDPKAWEVTSPYLQGQIDAAALAFCESTNETTSQELATATKQLREELAAGLVEQGESVAELTKRVMQVFDRAEEWRAKRIAMTEACRAVHAAQLEAAKQSEVVTGFRWLLSGDGCPLCVTVARRAPVVKLGQPFAVVGNNPDYSTVRHPPLHPHCRCAMTEVLDIDEQPEWATTLVQPEPEPQDYAEGEGPNETKPAPTPAPAPKPKPQPAKPKPAPEPAPTLKPEPAPVAPTIKPVPEPAPKPVEVEPKPKTEPGPAGKPVADALPLTDPRKKATLERTLKAITKVHGDGVLPEIPTQIDPKLDGEGAFLRYTATGKPIAIKINPKSESGSLTYAHEIGHFLELAGIPGGQPDRKDWTHGVMAEWHQAVQASEAVKGLRSEIESAHASATISSANKVIREYGAYLTNDKELWARAYAQYIATRSGDRLLLGQVEIVRENEHSLIRNTQWSDEDFAPIGAAIDKMFAGLGWRQ